VIPAAAITAWGVDRPWPSRQQIEQDLLLARLIVEIYRHPYLSDELVFRGGTCLHQLRLSRPWRYSEDLDFVRRTSTGVGQVFDALRTVADDLGLTVAKRVLNEHPKMVLRANSEDDGSAFLRIKIEVNTQERSPAQPLEVVPFVVTNSWFSGSADIVTFSAHELVATKIRALYQRRKGRDLFDLWLALGEMGLDPDLIVDAFSPYRPPGYTAILGIRNLRDKLANRSFRTDLLPLIAGDRLDGYDVDSAGEMVIERLLSRISD
jgi:predicted nucleotidyltransferase component of viral defense system